jgi:Zn finger protein HypA/HybF involved in hydrogenase expression
MARKNVRGNVERGILMETISCKCPDCGAELQAEQGRESIFCSYCGEDNAEK